MTKPYKHKLSKKDFKHLKKYGVVGWLAIKKQMKHLVHERKGTPFEPCWECKCIARKLGLPV